jgi:predicted nucleic acid-binding protein
LIVVDTNIVAYLLINGDKTADATAVARKDSEWAGPRLWRSEMRNLLTLYVRRGVFSRQAAVLIMEEALISMRDREFDVTSARVLELAETSGCTAYDCEFVSLAEKLGVPLVTSDKKLLAAFPTIAVSMESYTA